MHLSTVDANKEAVIWHDASVGERRKGGDGLSRAAGEPAVHCGPPSTDKEGTTCYTPANDTFSGCLADEMSCTADVS